jgi:hypothetical protein
MVQTITNLTLPVTRVTGLDRRLSPTPQRQRDAALQGPLADRMDLSAAALRQDDQAKPPGIRTELVNRLREDIAAGRYRTVDKMDVVIERLREEVLHG